MSHVPYRREHVIPGNTFQRQYLCKTGDAAFDLTGFVVRWTAYHGDHKIEKSTENGSLSVPDPTNGTVSLNLNPEDTRKVPVNDFMSYQFELISPTGVQTTSLYGDIVGLTGGYNLD